MSLGQLEQAPGRCFFDQLVLRFEDADFRSLGRPQFLAFEQFLQNREHIAVGNVQKPGTLVQQFVAVDEQVAALKLALFQNKKNAGADALAGRFFQCPWPWRWCRRS